MKYIISVEQYLIKISAMVKHIPEPPPVMNATLSLQLQILSSCNITKIHSMTCQSIFFQSTKLNDYNRFFKHK